MVSIQYHQDIKEKFPEVVVELTYMEDTKHENFNIKGIKLGVESTHTTKYWISLEDKYGTPAITIGFSKEIPVETLFGLPFMIGEICVPDFD